MGLIEAILACLAVFLATEAWFMRPTEDEEE